MIDTGSLTDLITKFRQTTQAQSVTPETVGSILQKIVDVLATAGTEANLSVVTQWHEALKAAAPALTSLAQGKSDRNHVYLNSKRVNLYTGAVTDYNDIQIQQATTERAGAMRAQQVVDLNAAKKSVANIEKQIETINALLKVTSGDSLASVVYKVSQISCQVVNGRLKLLGATQLMKDGYVPYLFRRSHKRNPYRDKKVAPDPEKKMCEDKKGWNLYGSRHAIKIDGQDATVLFSTNGRNELFKPCTTYTALPDNILRINGNDKVPWGRRLVSIWDESNPKKPKKRMLRFRFAIGFAKPLSPGRILITPANLVSSLAEFTLIFDPVKSKWVFNT